MTEKYRTPAWLARRRRHLLDQATCQVHHCGASHQLDVHHKVYRESRPARIGLMEWPGDLVTLCHAHHEHLHRLEKLATPEDYEGLLQYARWRAAELTCELLEAPDPVSPWWTLESLTDWFLDASKSDVDGVWARTQARLRAWEQQVAAILAELNVESSGTP